MNGIKDVFQMGQELCNQGQKLNDAFQNAYQNLQDVSRRNMRSGMQQPQQQVQAVPVVQQQFPNYSPENLNLNMMGAQPIQQLPPTFQAKPGFWNENYGR